MRTRKIRFAYILFGAISSLAIRLLSLPGIGTGQGRAHLHGELIFCFLADREGKQLILCLIFLSCFQLNIGLMV